MNFPKFWAKGQCGDFMCWRWSSNSLTEAKTLAAEAARKLAQRIKAGDFERQQGAYYPDRPFREQVLQEIKNPTGEIVAVVTRNSYGCLVLNTARVMFVDIDFPEQRAQMGFFSRLFGKPAPESTADLDAAIAKVEAWTRAQPEWGWRLYRTRAGLRLLSTQALHDADSQKSDEVFKALGADELYSKLCKNQKCFRARLTPKPWRCGVRGKPARWPWETASEERRFEKWGEKYRAESEAWATCQFLKHIGNAVVHEEIRSIVHLHDEMCRADSKMPLA